MVRDGRDTPRGQPTIRELGLAETLIDAPHVLELVGDTPLETVSILRLLLAVLYGCVDVTSASNWEGLWRSGRFPAAALTSYFDQWRGRFDLFDAEHPFYQAASIDVSTAGSVAKLLYQADNNATLFDHTVVDRPPALTPAKVARTLLVIQAFDTSGTKTGAKTEKMVTASPLVQSAVIVFRGATLFETLMLNLHRYSPDREDEPWSFKASADVPAWERDEETTTATRHPAGLRDLLTWQSRRIRAEPTGESGGAVVVKRAVVMKGECLPPEFERRNRETMLSFRRRREPLPGQSPWYPMRFLQDRAVWRDCLALFSALPSDTTCSKGARWLASLMDEGVLPASSLLPVDLYGLATDKAKCLFWRHDQMTIPSGLLRQEVVGWEVARALQLAENIAPIVSDRWANLRQSDGATRAAPTALAVLARGLITGDKDVPAVIRQLSGGRQFWVQLAVPFQRFLAALSAATDQDQSTQTDSRGDAMLQWREAVEDVAVAAFGVIVERTGVRGNALQAVAMGERTFRRQLRLVMGDWTTVTEEDGHARTGA
jgi:CRISPR system Cascade subunit CasA